MTTYIRELVLHQLSKAGVDISNLFGSNGRKGPKHPGGGVNATVDEGKVASLFLEAGFSTAIPSDDIPVAGLPAMIRLAKQSWLDMAGVRAAFAAEVEDGDIVCPSGSLWEKCVPEDGEVTSVFGVAFRPVGMVVFGPVVRHVVFSGHAAGEKLYLGAEGTLLASGEDTDGAACIGVCVGRGSALLKQAIF